MFYREGEYMFIFSLCLGLVLGAGTKIMEIKASTPKLQLNAHVSWEEI